MIDNSTFTYLVDWLVSAIKPEYDKSEDEKFGVKKMASYDGKLNKGTVSKLWVLFDKHICGGTEKRMRTKDGELYVFNGKWFEEVSETTFLKELVRRVLTELGVSPTYRFYGARDISSELKVRIANTEECRYKPDRRYIVFTNGVFDTIDGNLKKFSISYCTDLVLDFDYATFENGETEEQSNARRLWEQKMKEIIPNKDFQKAFQQFCGSLLVKREEMKIEYICYLYGNGSNGKSVLASAIANVFGERYYSTFTPQQLFKEGSGASMFNMKELQGKILNLCDDLTASDFSGGAFKRFISGEMQTGRGVHSKDFVKVRPPMMLCCTNHLPTQVTDDSYGHHRRQLPIFTTRTQFEGDKRDPNLTDKLSKTPVRQYIFWWIYKGYRMLRNKKGNIELGGSVEKAMAQLLAESNPMRSWAQESGLTKVVVEGGWSDKRWKPLKDWFAAFCQWCKENGYPNNKISRDLSMMFESMGFEKKRRSKIVIGTWWCIGVLGYDTDKNGNYTDPKLRELTEQNLQLGNIL